MRTATIQRELLLVLSSGLLCTLLVLLVSSFLPCSPSVTSNSRPLPVVDKARLLATLPSSTRTFLPPGSLNFCEDLPSNVTSYNNHYHQLKEKLELELTKHKITEGHSGQMNWEFFFYHRLSMEPWVKTVCETCFNAGHSAFQWLVSSSAEMHSFDLGMHDYTVPMGKFVGDLFRGRLYLTLGNSLGTIPKADFEGKCDVVIVDGGHSETVAHGDIVNMARIANPQRHVLIVDDLPVKSKSGHGVNMAWLEAQASGLISPLTGCWTRKEKNRGFMVGMYNKVLSGKGKGSERD